MSRIHAASRLLDAMVGTAVDPCTKRQGLVRLWKHEHRGAMFAAVLAGHHDSMRRSLRGMKRSGRGERITS